MTINMRAAFEALKAMCAEEGYPEAFVSVRLDIDDYHAHTEKVRFSAAAHLSADQIVSVYDQPTPDAALSALRVEIRRHREARERAALPRPPIEAAERVEA